MAILIITLLTIIALAIVTIHLRSEDIKEEEKLKELKLKEKEKIQEKKYIEYNKENADELTYYLLKEINENLELIQKNQKKQDEKLESIKTNVAILVFFIVILPIIVFMIRLIFKINILQEILQNM